MWRRIWKHDLRVPLLTLVAASALGAALVGARVLLTWRAQHLYLVWNLILAWVPLILALRIEEMEKRGAAGGWRFRTTVVAWLLFFPNAPYIFTDLTHLKPARITHWWTDLILILLFAVIGLVLAFMSLHRMHSVVSRRHGWIIGWAFVFAVAFASGFGVYLGRFERWNSWDVVANPIGLLADCFNSVHGRSAKFTVLFGIFLSTAYALLYSLTSLGPTLRIAPEVRTATE
jgi:uncharacterized membrane protein